MAHTGMTAMLELLAGCGVRYLFGNPGTTELPLSDALLDEPRIRYILGLQEIPVMAMADGYAQASGGLGVVNLHTCCGLGNAMGMLFNAYRANTPLLVTAGQQDRRLAFEEPILWGRMVDVVRPWTKWAAEIDHAADLPSAVRRAVQTALTPPTGPVFLALPLDVQQAIGDYDLTPPRPPSPLVRPPREALARAAALLAAAERPALLVGNRVCEAEAVAEAVAVADQLGATVWHETPVTHGRCSFPADHPLAAGPLPFWSPEIRAALAEYDVVLAVGVKLLQLYIYHEPARAVPEHVRVIHADDDPWELGKNYPVEVGLIGHPRATLAELHDVLAASLSPAAVRAAAARRATAADRLAQRRAALLREAESQRDARPLTPSALMQCLAGVLPPQVAVIEESPTTAQSYFERSGALKNTTGYFAQRGWALGWGLNCAIGVKLAWPDRPVLALLGDGSALYGLQGLWTAAHYRIAVTFVVTNNREYRILKDCAKVLNLPGAMADRFCELDVASPAIDYVGLARSLGVAATRVSEPDDLAAAVRRGLGSDVPQLIEVPVAQYARSNL